MPFAEFAVLSAIILMAVSLRIYRLAHWGLEGDELNTLRDSLTTSSFTTGSPKPLLFFLNYHLLAPWTTLNEVSLRVFPAVFGITSIIVVYWFARRTTNSSTALFAAFLLTLGPTHLYFSQYARYHTLAFLLTTIFTFAFYIGIREPSMRWIAIGLVSSVLAWFAHPPTAAVAAGIGVWACWNLGTVTRLQPDVIGRKAKWLARMILAVIILGSLFYGIPVLDAWHRHGEIWGKGWIHLLASYTDSVSSGVLLFGSVGIGWLWSSKHRPLAALMAAVVCIPVILFAVLSSFVNVTSGYLFVTTFALYVGAGYFLDQVAELTRGRGVQRLAAWACLAVLSAECAPRLLSHYLDGGRADFRSAAHFVQGRLGAGDIVRADQPKAVKYYLPEVPVEGFRVGPDKLTELLRQPQDPNASGVLWIIAEFKRRGGFNDKDLGGMADWIDSRCRLAASFSTPRLDYKFNELGVYRCSGSSNPSNKPPDG